MSLSDENGNTALHIAASIPNSDICYLLRDYNADPKAKNKVSLLVIGYRIYNVRLGMWFTGTANNLFDHLIF